ncbi:hypothetical protein STEG23_001625 [Scotinomys teguina]
MTIVPQLGIGALEPLSSHTGILTGSLIYKSCSGEKFPDNSPKVQLLMTYEDSRLTILVKHMKNIVVYDEVLELQGHVLMLIVKSKAVFVGAINIQLSSVPLNEEKWYPLGNTII